ncbi:MAG: tRNA lysidine(34) synthetase TilS [Ruminococcus sp.]|nr:tRNA lysidine(34) synthetase TilS [Ruminococcus sp.]
MKHKLGAALDKYLMLDSCDKVIVALSGGADSVALLHCLNSVKELYNITLYACHLNHMIRGDEAERDEKFVRDLCSALGIELFVRKVDVVKLAQEQKQSLELTGRNVRYEFFKELSDKLSAKVATAHTASDNAETVLYNLTRGTAVTGLTGIRPVRDYIIRPLILCVREDIERYCDENNLQYVTDSTNLTDDYTRNNIRHNVVPVLKGINPDFMDAVSRMSDTMMDVKIYLDKISLIEIKNCKTDYGYDAKKLLDLDKAVLTHSLCMIAKNRGVVISNRHVELIIDALKNGGAVDLENGKRAVCKQGVLRIVDSSLSESCDKADEVAFSGSGFAEYISKEELKNVNKKLLINCINCDIITDSTVIRTRKEGDTFTLCNRNVTKSLKKLFNELKIPAEKRSELKLIANGSNVLWIEGIGVSEYGKVNSNTEGAYLITGGNYD